MNYLSEKELLELKQKSERSTITIVHGSFWEYRSYVLEIPKLVDEILELRKEIKYSQKLQNLREIYEQ